MLAWRCRHLQQCNVHGSVPYASQNAKGQMLSGTAMPPVLATR
jgi:hypothetical protein